MNNIRKSIKLFRYNMVNTILFEIIFKTVSFAVLIPLYYTFINFTVRIAGINYLTKETVKKFLRQPSTYAFLFISLMFVSMYIMINVSAISYAYHRANQLKKTDPFRMLLMGLHCSLRILRPRNMPVFPFVLCYLPVITNVILNFSLLNIKVPYIMDLVSVNMYVTIGLIVIYSLMLLYSLRYTFLLHLFNIEKISFRKAIDRSKEILKGHRLKTIGGVFTWSLFIIGVPALLNVVYTGPLLETILENESATKVATLVYESGKIVLSVVYVIIGLPLVYSYICNAFYDLVPKEAGEANIDEFYDYDAKKSARRESRVLAVILILAIVLNAGFYVLKKYDVISINANYLDKVLITAHRGDCSAAPENTLASFELAIENGADVIELDVRQTKDGEVVIMHDATLKRTCGVNKKVGELTYEELSKYSAGAKYKGPDKELYKDEKIPTLREAIELIGDRADINIELKPAKTDHNLSQKVVEIIEEYDYFDQCVVASMSYKAITKAKLADERVNTVYVMSVAMGDFSGLEYADAFSIKYRYISNDVIRNAHNAGKKVYAWVVDDSQTLESMMLLNVDCIITNNPAKMRRAMYENYYGDTLIQRIFTMLQNQL